MSELLLSELLPAAAGLLLAAAAVLMLVPSASGRASRASERQQRRKLPRGAAEMASTDAAGLLDLTGALLVSGVGIEAALERLASCVPGAEPLAQVGRSLTAGADWESAWAAAGRHGELAAFGEHLAFAHATGAPTAELLEAGARQLRAGRRQEAERRAARLGVQMVIPLGACFLPAFVLLGVLPVILSLLPGAMGAAS